LIRIVATAVGTIAHTRRIRKAVGGPTNAKKFHNTLIDIRETV